MTIIKKEYAHNGGKEFVARDGDKYFINSYIAGIGWMGQRRVSRHDIERCMDYTTAPASVRTAILGA